MGGSRVGFGRTMKATPAEEESHFQSDIPACSLSAEAPVASFLWDNLVSPVQLPDAPLPSMWPISYNACAKTGKAQEHPNHPRSQEAKRARRPVQQQIDDLEDATFHN
eukprot:5687075-Amphidinium_carterae.1